MIGHTSTENMEYKARENEKKESDKTTSKKQKNREIKKSKMFYHSLQMRKVNDDLII